MKAKDIFSAIWNSKLRGYLFGLLLFVGGAGTGAGITATEAINAGAALDGVVNSAQEAIEGAREGDDQDQDQEGGQDGDQ